MCVYAWQGENRFIAAVQVISVHTMKVGMKQCKYTLRECSCITN